MIVAATVTSGEKGDGPQLPELIEKTRDNGIQVDTVVGDGAIMEGQMNYIYPFSSSFHASK